MSTIQLPLTSGASNGLSLWQQQEYVACKKAGYGFAGHGATSGYVAWWHYKLPDGCVSLRMSGGVPDKRIDHTFAVGIDWIERCRTAVAKEEA